MGNVGRVKVDIQAGGNIVECQPHISMFILTGAECNFSMTTMIYLVSSKGV